jgi:hypothetical protein
MSAQDKNQKDKKGSDSKKPGSDKSPKRGTSKPTKK